MPDFDRDRQDLLYALVNILGIDINTFGEDPTALALFSAGVVTWSTFLMLSDEDYKDLQVAPSTPHGHPVPLPLAYRRKLHALSSFQHAASYQAGKTSRITRCTKAMYDAYRVAEYDPNVPIKPWSTKAGLSATSPTEALNSWNRAVRPSASDFKLFKDETIWSRYKEEFTTSAEAIGLSHLLDDKHVPGDPILDAKQRNWLYKVMQDKIQCPTARAIVTAHLKDKDTRAIWKEICATLDKSMASALKSQRISAFLTAKPFDQQGWRGTQVSQIHFWQEQARVYNEISENPYTDPQLIQFLNTAVSPLENLRGILTTWKTSQKATGSDETLTLATYVNLLVEQASVYDNG